MGDTDLLNYIQAGYYRSKKFPEEPAIYRDKTQKKKGMNLDTLAKTLQANIKK